MEEKRVAGTKYEYFTHKNVFLVFKNKGTHSNSLYMNAILGGLKTHIVEVTLKKNKDKYVSSVFSTIKNEFTDVYYCYFIWRLYIYLF